MDRDIIEKRMRDLEAGMAALRLRIADTDEVGKQLRENLSATGGAHQECQFWLSQLPAPDLREVKDTGAAA